MSSNISKSFIWCRQENLIDFYILQAVKSEIIYLLLQIEGKEPDSFVNKPPVDVKGWCVAVALA